jgi:hypothetical protein
MPGLVEMLPTKQSLDEIQQLYSSLQVFTSFAPSQSAVLVLAVLQYFMYFSSNETAITMGDQIVLLPSTTFSYNTTCLCDHLLAKFLARDCHEGI